MAESQKHSSCLIWACGIAAALALPPIVCCGTLGFVSPGIFGAYSIQQFELNNRTQLRLLANDHEMGQGLLYEIRRDGNVIHRRSCGSNGLQFEKDRAAPFRLLSLNGGEVIAIHHKARPHLLHVMYDLKTGDVWPSTKDSVQEDVAAGDRLLKRITSITGDNCYTYSDYCGSE